MSVFAKMLLINIQKTPNYSFRIKIHENIVFKWKDSVEGGNLDQVVFAAELEFLKILIPRLPQNTSNINIECAGILIQLCSVL